MRHSKTDRFHALLFQLILALLFVPWLQSHFEWFEEEPLHGALTEKMNLPLSEDSWLDGRFQKYREEYLNDHFGFRNTAVRIHNQIDFSVFKKVHARSVVIGKENVLFEENYITTYFGRDFIGEEAIRKRMSQLRKIQDSLAVHGKTFLLVFAASKGQFYPEYFPDSCSQTKGSTNYEFHLKLAREYQINHIDFNAWVVEQKEHMEYPWYPKYGIHWSYYAACRVADSLLHYIEAKRHVDMPDLKWNRIRMESARKDDRDIERGMNLLFSLKGPELAYPDIYFESKEGKDKISAMVVADSYFWSLFNLGIGNSFEDLAFWYYQSQVWRPHVEFPEVATPELRKKALRSNDLVILMATDANLYNLGWGFMDFIEAFIDDQSYIEPDFNERVESLKNYIPTDSAWIRDIRIKAAQRGLTVDSMITLDAIWMVEQEMKTKR
ncbi:MAG TPA: hypothetical protein VFX48_04145 [Saprospiraceae bacterium]|nr:hypothetical protein [Saprospiraceae bacterium]